MNTISQLYIYIQDLSMAAVDNVMGNNSAVYQVI